jgi:hypothetical protein
VVDRDHQWVSYRLNILGVRVYRTYCRLSAKRQHGWEPVGPPRSLPIAIPNDQGGADEDPLLLTLSQYDRECPGSDLMDLLSGRKTFDAALREPGVMPFP